MHHLCAHPTSIVVRMQILFLCTANVADTIPGPLLDRMEVVRLSGYILDEKVCEGRAYESLSPCTGFATLSTNAAMIIDSALNRGSQSHALPF